MMKKIKSAMRVKEIEFAFRCPICHHPLIVDDLRMMVCAKRHTFDFSKQGYVNLLTRQINSQYTKELFEARRKIICETELYGKMHQLIASIIEEHFDNTLKANDRQSQMFLVDIGCGEGSHLHKIVENCKLKASGIGLDIAKEAILMAAKRHDELIWLVGDLANTPFADQTFHVILNILSPSNYDEFKRIVAEKGIVIKVVPRTEYLKELRQTLFKGQEKSIYQNDKTISLFKDHFRTVEVSNIRYCKKLKKEELKNLVEMTPLAWTADQQRIESFVNQEMSEITIDLDLLVGVV
ncbi:methyltransferase domain-containing protein [Bacillus sp. P2(2020)]|uniref:Methyltransferase domain-containing protein n=2 Tax=Calidifontibacillus erzurumensis TaxID=2741433 RepID=A0A8J8KAV1_9BACI|nr:methyltransferase domain-containing protein [Calidifontibacillus erzurumensis]